jgi:hypothetical protein
MSIIKEFVHNESFLALTIHLPELLTSFRIHIENYFRYLILTFGVDCCVRLDGQRAPPSFESDHSLLTPCLQLCEKQHCTISYSIYLHVLRTLGYTGPKCPKINKMWQSALWTTKKIHISTLWAFTPYTHCDTLPTPTLLPSPNTHHHSKAHAPEVDTERMSIQLTTFLVYSHLGQTINLHWCNHDYLVNYLGAQTIPVSAGCHTDDPLLITGLLGMCIWEKETWVESLAPECSPDVT